MLYVGLVQVMTTDVTTATEPVSLEEANLILKSSKKGKLPVVDNTGKVQVKCTFLYGTFFVSGGRGTFR